MTDFINDYFNDNKFFSLELNQEKLEKLDLENLFPEIYSIQKRHSEKYKSKLTNKSRLSKFILMIVRDLQKESLSNNLNMKASFNEAILRMIDKFDDFLILHPFFDDSCFQFFEKSFSLIFQNDRSKLEDILNDYNQWKNKIPIERKFNILNIVTTIQDYYANKWESLTVQEAFDPNNYAWYDKYKKTKKSKKLKFLDDWTLKLGQLVENYYKINLVVLGKIIYNNDPKKYKKFDELHKPPSIGTVYSFFDKDFKRYKNFNKLRVMRNAVDHGDVDFIYLTQSNEYEIKFTSKDKNEDFTCSVENFIIDYYKLLKFNFTFDITCKIYEIKVKNPKTPYSDVLKQIYLVVINSNNHFLNKSNLIIRIKFIRKIITNYLFSLKNKLESDH